MDKKLEYITRLFKKMNAKGIETYVISRLWHLLNNDEIKIVPQQYVRHASGQYSMTDIYFPQFDIHVEVNEPGHYRSEAKILNDGLRERNIIAASGHEVRTIDCMQDLQEMHRQVDSLVSEIKMALNIKLAANLFQPWQPDWEYKAVYYRQFGTLWANGQVALETIEQICELFGVEVPKRGFLRKGAVTYPAMENTIIWWPGAYNANWENHISPDGCTITERAAEINIRGTHAAGIMTHPTGESLFSGIGMFWAIAITDLKASLCWISPVPIPPMD